MRGSPLKRTMTAARAFIDRYTVGVRREEIRNPISPRTASPRWPPVNHARNTKEEDVKEKKRWKIKILRH